MILLAKQEKAHKGGQPTPYVVSLDRKLAEKIQIKRTFSGHKRTSEDHESVGQIERSIGKGKFDVLF